MRIARAIVVSFFISSTIACAQTPNAPNATPPAPDSSKPPPPTIEFLHPQANEKFSDYPLHIQVTVNNFRLLPPVQYWTKVEPEDEAKGHIHYTLDDSPIYATSKTEIVLGKNANKSLPAGKHILRAELRYINHEGLKTPVFAEIPILCERADKLDDKDSAVGSSSIKGGAKEQLDQIEFQIRQVQRQLQQLQKGDSARQQVPANNESNKTAPATTAK